MNIQVKKCLVTGADGFIGSHLVEALVAEGANVRAFVFYNSFNSWGWIDSLPESRQDQLEVFPGDVRDPNGIRTAMDGCDVVFHLAALIGIPFSYHSPDSYVDTNIKGTLNVLQAARQRIRPKNSEVERLLGSTEKLFSLTNSRPQISLDAGLQRTVDWFSEKSSLAHVDLMFTLCRWK